MPVKSLGITGDPTTLVGKVKLSPGPGVTLTRVDADNAIRIEATGMADVSCKLYRTALLAIPHLATTFIPWQAELWDTHEFWLPGLPTKLVVPQTGIYLLVASLAIQANATGYRHLDARLNGFAVVARTDVPGTATTALTVNLTATLSLAAGNYLELTASQNSGIQLQAFEGTTNTIVALHRIA